MTSLSAGTEEWIKGYVRERESAFPEASVITELLAASPCAAGPVYRGINLRTEADWNRLVSRTQDFTTYEDSGVTSWSRRVESAAEYCLTRPTYELNRDLMEDEGKRSRDRDHMIGFAGVVLRLDLAGGAGVDLDKAGHGIGGEAEVLLPPGTYRISLERLEVPFMRSINEENVGEHLLALDPTKLKGHDAAKFNHIINRFDEFTDEQRHHLFRLAAASAPEMTGGAVLSWRDDYITRSRSKMAVVNIWCDIPDEFLSHYDKFLPDDQSKIDRLLSDAISAVDTEFEAAVANVNWTESIFDFVVSPTLVHAVRTGRIKARFVDAVNAASVMHYLHHTSYEATDRLNNLPPREKRDAITYHGRRISHVLNQQIRVPTPRPGMPRP